MSTRLRSSSVGSKPKPRLHRTSRAESAAVLALDVRCACQFFETKSLLPERVNPVGYNAAEEFEPCVHVQARYKEPIVKTIGGADVGYPVTSSTSVQSPIARPPSPQPPQTYADNLPLEFAPENANAENIEEDMPPSSPPLGNRSASCANMGAQPSMPQLIKQRDPSTSSLLRKRMSEERQSFSGMNKRMSQSTVSRDRIITQKDPSQSTILRKRSSASFDRAGSEVISNEHLQRYQSQPSRIPNERTFYHDSNDNMRNLNLEIDAPINEFGTPKKDVEMAAPLSMNSQGNRRFVLSSTENLSQNLYAKTSVETEPDSGIDSNFVDDPPRNTDIEKQLMRNQRRVSGQNVSDEEKVQILLSKSQTVNVVEKIKMEVKPNVIETQQTKSSESASDGYKPTTPKRRSKMHKMQLLSANDVKKVEMPKHSKSQTVTEVENVSRPLQAQSSEYSFSKLFDNYKSPERPERPSSQMSNISTPDLGSNYIRQRDPSQSPFTQNRYRSIHSATPSSHAGQALYRAPTPLSMDLKLSHDKLLPPAGDFPERRASEISNPPPPSSQFIKQKDMRTSNILNRRRRNLSQTSLGHESDPLKVVKTISFEKNLSEFDDDQMSPYTDTTNDVKISQGVCFEYEKPLPADRSARNEFDFSNPSASRRPFR